MRRVCVVITARPSYSRIKTALLHMRANGDVDLRIVTSASANLERYGRVHDQIERDLFTIDTIAHNVIEGDLPSCMVQTTGLSMIHLAQIFERMKPDVVVTIADRYETLATASAAAYMNIPLCHIQGGEITGSIDDKVRNAVTQLADIHCVSTMGAAERVCMMQPNLVQGTNVHFTGCPSIDLAAIPRRLENRYLHGGVGPDIDTDSPFLIVLQHPVTDEHEDAGRQARATALAIDAVGIPTIWFWPNVDAGSDGTSKALRSLREDGELTRTHFVRSLSPEHFLALAQRAACIVGNSSFGIREASFLGLPAVNIGTRQQGRERAHNVKDVPHDVNEIQKAILWNDCKSGRNNRFVRSTLYGDGKAGQRIAHILAGN